MKVFFHYISEYVPKCWDINDDNENVLEAINIALKLKNDFNIYPYYFYFTDDKGQKIDETKYYINGQILNSREIRALDRELYNYSISNKWDKMIKLAPKDQVVLYEPFFENIDTNISI